MIPAAVFLSVVAVWIVAYFFHTFLQTCQNYPYLWLLNRTGLSLHLGYARWYTTALNRVFQRLGSWKPRLLQRWFNFGAVCGLFLIVPSFVLLVVTISKYLLRGTTVVDQTLIPAFPGVNLPLNEIVYYCLTLLICSIIHELGHAAAAVREDVRVLGCGLLVLGVVPAAFVELPPEQLRQLTPWQQMRIFCAGIWHNIILVILAALVLVSLPVVCAGLYTTGVGVVITHVQEGSAAAGRAGFIIQDHITGVGDCPVTDSLSWLRCLELSTTPVGYCTDNHFIESFDEAVKDFNKEAESVECCPLNSEHGVCFKLNDPNAVRSHVCMPARQVIAQAPVLCNTSLDCPSTRYTCLIPAVDPSTKLLAVHRQDKEDMLFLGYPGDLYYAVTLSDYLPKWSFVPLRFPSIVDTMCRYIISFSGALALLNVVPCFALDGQWITQAAVDLLLIGLVPCKQTRNIIFTILLAIGTLILVANIVLGVLALF